MQLKLPLVSLFFLAGSGVLPLANFNGKAITGSAFAAAAQPAAAKAKPDTAAKAKAQTPAAATAAQPAAAKPAPAAAPVATTPVAASTVATPAAPPAAKHDTSAKAAPVPAPPVATQPVPVPAPVPVPVPVAPTPQPVATPAPAQVASAAVVPLMPQPGNGPPGFIYLFSSPSVADISIDGRPTGKKTPSKVDLPSGNHRVEFMKNGQRALIDLVVLQGNNKALHLPLQ